MQDQGAWNENPVFIVRVYQEDYMAFSQQDARRYQAMLQRLQNQEDIDPIQLCNHLDWLDKQDLHHARPGFDYWYKAFVDYINDPERDSFRGVDKYIDKYMFGETEHHCSTLNTVNVAMMSFVTMLKYKHAWLLSTTETSDPRLAVRYAMLGPDELWRERLDAAMRRKDIANVDEWSKAVEARYAAKAEQDREETRKVNARSPIK